MLPGVHNVVEENGDLAEAIKCLVPAIATAGGLFAQKGVDSVHLAGLFHVPCQVAVDVAVGRHGMPKDGGG